MKKQVKTSKKTVKLPPSTFEDIISRCRELHSKYPNWRFGQIVANAVRYFDGRVYCDPFHIDNKAILQGLDNLLNPNEIQN